MRRVVKAWCVVDPAGGIGTGAIFDTRQWARMGKPDLAGWHVVPCTITYDDGKPARKKGALK